MFAKSGGGKNVKLQTRAINRIHLHNIKFLLHSTFSKGSLKNNF